MELFVNGGNPLPATGNLLGNAGAPPLLLAQLLPDAGHILLVVADAPLEESNLPVQLPAGGLQGRHLLPNCLQGRVLLPQGPAQLLRLPVQAVQRHVLLLQHEGGRGVILLRLFGGSRNFVQVLQPDCNLQSPELLFVCQVISGLF